MKTDQKKIKDFVIDENKYRDIILDDNNSNKDDYIALFNVLVVFFLIYQVISFFNGQGDEIEYVSKNIENINFIEFEEEIKFREKIVNKFQTEYLKKDSLNIAKTYKYVFTDLSLIKTISTKELDIKDIKGIPTSKVYDFLTLKYEYKINPYKFNPIITSDVSYDNFIGFLKYRDYLNVKVSIVKKVRYNLFIVFASIWFFINILLYYVPKMFTRTEKGYTLNEKTKEKNKVFFQKKKIEIQKKLDNENDKKYRDDILKELDKTAERIELLMIVDSVEHFLNVNIENSKKQTTETKNRATAMLLSGLVMSFTAITIFYVTLPEYNSESYKEFVIKGIRPTAILIFIESISWYLLRQYRKMISDYKYFHSILQNKIKHLEIFKLMKDADKKDNKVLIDYIISEYKTGMVENNIDKNEKFESLKFLKDLININVNK